MCQRLDEDGGHLLFKCKFAKAVWSELNMEEKRIVLSDRISSTDVLHQIWEWECDTQIQLITLLWVLWTTRNDKQAPSTITNVDKWELPPVDYLEMNVDGSFKEQMEVGLYRAGS
jgi:hypothetical protein